MSARNHRGTTPPKNTPILVTIARERVAAVEEEERQVAARIAAGETDIVYWWSLGTLPKELPTRIYFCWNGAVRAYHETLHMNRVEKRIYMRPEIHHVDPPIPHKGFQGFRYFQEAK